ncbi:MAG: DUF1249 domain-containing protein [Methylophagaceae bacterium]
MFKSKQSTKIIKSDYINKDCVSIQHEDNYQLLNLLLPKLLIEMKTYKSTIAEKPSLIIKVLNKYKYTIELEFSYLFNFGKSEKINIKLYQDAKVAEIVYCTNVQQFIRLMGPKICPKIHKKTRNVLNIFLNKWLNYLLKNGYSQHQWETSS